MENQNSEHYLKVLIELQLYPVLRVLTEGNFSKTEINREQQKSIIDFINKLPEEYKKIPNRDEIIAKTLQRMGMKTVWGEKKIEEISAVTKREGYVQKRDKSPLKSEKDSEEMER